MLGFGVIYVPAFYKLFEFIGRLFISVINFSKEGSRFLFGELVNSDKVGIIFAFQILPAIIFIGALTGALYYYGIIQWVVKLLARLLQRLMSISGPESLATSANIFLGQSESPLLIKSYLEKMSRPEIFQVGARGEPSVIVARAFQICPGVTQGFVWTTLLFYLFVDVIFGMMAYLTKSILPGIVVHTIGLLTFFTLVWPYDATRRLVSEGGADAWFWAHTAQAIIFTVLAVLAFRQLAKVIEHDRVSRVSSAAV